MLIALAALVVVLTAAAIAARARATSALSDRTHHQLRLAWAICDAAETPVIEWLEEESRGTVLDPDTPPMVRILEDTMAIRGHEVVVSVIAWDQTGMVPAIDLSQSPAFRSLLSEQQRSAVGWLGSEAPGLDMASGRVPTFPTAENPEALGGRIATHNPAPGPIRRRGGELPSMNVNTAPEALLRAVYRHLDLSGVEDVLAARSAGERTKIDQRRGNDAAAFRLVGSSTAWGVRTDVSVGGLRASVWSVYTVRGGSWTREQRLVIPE